MGDPDRDDHRLLRGHHQEVEVERQVGGII
jgi:hypothetical protein